MNKIIEEFNKVIQIFNTNYNFDSIEEIKSSNYIDWYYISANQAISEDFIREFQDKVDWDSISVHRALSEDFIREFQDKVNWISIDTHQTLSENFIREFQDKVHWGRISKFQTLSEDFIREFQHKINWNLISQYQTLSENFIREFQDKVNWDLISQYQTISEDFIREFQEEVNWDLISQGQILSYSFTEEFLNEEQQDRQKAVHPNLSIETKKQNSIAYCKKYNLEYNNEGFFAYRFHDKNGSGYYNKTTKYKLNKYYRDFHCDHRKDVENSFGFGIWPLKKHVNVNVKIFVKFEDFGIEVDREDGKGRVWGFTPLENIK